MDHDVNISNLFKERMKEKGLSLKRLSDMSGIPFQHLESLVEGVYDNLPPAPYLRGYLEALAPILDFDARVMWEHFRMSGAVPQSGRRDRLPMNRFAPRSVTGIAWAIIAGVIVVAYLGLRFSHIFGRPSLSIRTPAETLSQTLEASIMVAGHLENGDTILVNGETVPLGGGGEWEKRVTLQPGLNTVAIEAKKFLGGTTRMLRQVMYEAPLAPRTTSTTVLSTPVSPSSAVPAVP